MSVFDVQCIHNLPYVDIICRCLKLTPPMLTGAVEPQVTSKLLAVPFSLSIKLM